MWSERTAGARLTMDFSQEYISVPSIGSHVKPVKGKAMRVTFTIEIKAEIESYDLAKREVFVKMMTDAAKNLHTKAVMLSDKVSPNMKVLVGDNSGIQTINLMGEKQ